MQMRHESESYVLVCGPLKAWGDAPITHWGWGSFSGKLTPQPQGPISSCFPPAHEMGIWGPSPICLTPTFPDGVREGGIEEKE